MQISSFDSTQESMTERRDSVSTGQDDAPELTNTSVGTSEDSRVGDQRQHARSSSPSKRPASEMEEDTVLNSVEHMEIDGAPATTTSHQPTHAHNVRSINPPSPSSSNTEDTRDHRGNSIDMTDMNHVHETSGQSSGTTPRSVQSSNTSTSAATNDTVSTTAPNGEGTAAQDLPAIDEQVALVYREVMKPIETEGQTGYLISAAWLGRVLSRSSDAENYGPFEKSAMEGDIGPVDNSSIVEGTPLDQSLADERGELFIPVKTGLRFGEDYQCVPEAAFKQVVEWYGLAPGQQPIKRYAHNTAEQADFEVFQFEVYPPIFTLRKLRNDSAGLTATAQLIKDVQATAPRIVASRHERYQSFLKRVKELLDVPLQTKVRLWRVLEAEQTAGATKPATKNGPNNMLSPPASREPSPNRQQVVPKVLIDVNAFSSMTEGSQREMIDIPDDTNNGKYNGSINLGTLGLAADQVLILEEQMSKAGEEFVSDAARQAATKNGLSLKKGLSASQPASGRSSPAPSAIMTRGRTRAQGKPKGIVGLTNLGNTCYMNSALQCVRSVEELTTYFLSNRWKEELNTDNPLGHSGNIAKAYAGLINQIYSDSQTSSFAPRNFKQTLSRYGTQFSGYGQQDSQEFMSFLVDGLHEDLNRIKKKPYSENPESDDNTVNDPEAIKALGEKFRENHRARNNSVAMDLFNGFYKNTMVCPDCAKVSITFDPFSLLTLQLPIENTFQHKFTFMPLYGYPVVIDVDMDKNLTYRELKQFVANRIPGTDPHRMMIAEAYSGKFYKLCEDKMSLMEANISQNDDMIIYELDSKPTNYPPPRTKKKTRSMLQIFDNDSDDEVTGEEAKYEENMMVTVFHRIPSHSHYSSNSKSIGLWPTFITLTKDEARSETEIRRKIIGRVATMTTRDFITEFADEDAEDPDTVITTEEDASSSADPSVQAQSVESEDDTVDISMTEHAPQSGSKTPGKFSFLKKKPAMLEAGAPIPEQLEGIFELKYVPAGKDMINSGWQNLEYSKNYPTLKSRIPKDQTPSDQSSTSQSPTATPGSSDVEDDAELSAAANPGPSMEEYESSDSGYPPFTTAKPGSSLNNRRGGKKGKNKKKTYSKKEKRAAARRANNMRNVTPEPEDDGSRGDGALIRLKEAIVVDWNPDAFDTLFRDAEFGQESRKQAETLEDPELKAKRDKRIARKKSGVTLEECFAETSKGEKLSQDNAWYCGRCKELRQAQKTLEIWTAPDILVIHLKRFSANKNFRDKVDILIDFPVEGLDLSDKVGLTEDKDMTYDLIAVDNHYGGLGGGHYTAFAKNFLDGEWYEYNGVSIYPLARIYRD
jgi:ubiquitin carboxyl-terminal hydrolase 4/11